MVAIGTLLSTFWIIVAQQLDADARPASRSSTADSCRPTGWRSSSIRRSRFAFSTRSVAVYLTTAFTVIGVAAYYLRGGRFVAESKVMIVMGFVLASLLVPLQALIGDVHGLNTLEHQPPKLAAIEGIWDTGPGQSAVLFAIPDSAGEEPLRDRDPEARELLSHARLERRRQRPEGLSARRPAPGGSGVLRLQGDDRHVVDHAGAHPRRWWLALAQAALHIAAVPRRGTCAIPVGYVAVTAGWVTTEVGRQPWVVYGHLRTADAVTPFLTGRRHGVAARLYCGVSLSSAPARTTSCTSCDEDFPPRTRGTSRSSTERPARPLSAATDVEATPMTLDLVPIWTIDPRRRRLHVRAARRLRSRRRHSLSVRAQRRGARPDDQFRRADLGRQRDLARARRHRPASRRSRWRSPSSFRRCTSRSSLMLLGLIFRGVAFEFRPTAAQEPKHSGTARSSGARSSRPSPRACVLGKFVQGFAVTGRQFAGRASTGRIRFVLPVRSRAGLRVRAARRDVARHEDGRRAARMGPAEARFCLFGVLAFIAMVSIWTPLFEPRIAARWFAWPNIALSRRRCPIVTARGWVVAVERARRAARHHAVLRGDRPFRDVLPRDSASALFRTSFPTRSRCGTRRARRSRRRSCFSARCSCCRSS